MNRIVLIATTGILYGCAGMGSTPPSQPGQPPIPIAGKTPLGATVLQMEAVLVGWSARKDLLDKPVINETNETIGKIDDLIITPDNAVSFAIIGTGGFLGVARHDVAIPMNHIKLVNGRLVLPGATKEALKALPPFVYARR